MITDHKFEFKEDAEYAGSHYGSELAADISYCGFTDRETGVCNRPYEEHARTGASELKAAIAAAKPLLAAELKGETVTVRLDAQGHLVLTDEEIRRVADKVIEIITEDLQQWLTLVQSSLTKDLSKDGSKSKSSSTDPAQSES